MVSNNETRWKVSDSHGTVCCIHRLPTVATGKFTEGDGEYWVYNARLSYETPNYVLGLWIKNLTDEEYYPYGVSVENVFANGYRIIAPPRTYGAEFKYMF